MPNFILAIMFALTAAIVVPIAAAEQDSTSDAPSAELKRAEEDAAVAEARAKEAEAARREREADAAE